MEPDVLWLRKRKTIHYITLLWSGWEKIGGRPVLLTLGSSGAGINGAGGFDWHWIPHSQWRLMIDIGLLLVSGD